MVHMPIEPLNFNPFYTKLKALLSYTISYTYLYRSQRLENIRVAAAVNCHQQSSICRLLLMLFSVTETRLVTDSTDSIFSFAAGEGLMRVWRASVRRDPP